MKGISVGATTRGAERIEKNVAECARAWADKKDKADWSEAQAKWEAGLVRQATFRPDGTQTDVPARDSEKPQLEKQLNIFGWAEGIEKLAKLTQDKVA